MTNTTDMIPGLQPDSSSPAGGLPVPPLPGQGGQRRLLAALAVVALTVLALTGILHWMSEQEILSLSRERGKRVSVIISKALSQAMPEAEDSRIPLLTRDPRLAATLEDTVRQIDIHQISVFSLQGETLYSSSPLVPAHRLRGGKPAFQPEENRLLPDFAGTPPGEMAYSSTMSARVTVPLVAPASGATMAYAEITFDVSRQVEHFRLWLLVTILVLSLSLATLYAVILSFWRENRRLLSQMTQQAATENRERLHLLQHLRHQERNLRAIADHAPALMAVLDGQERVVMANQRWSDWLDLDPVGMIGHPLPDWLTGDDPLHDSLEVVRSGRSLSYERLLAFRHGSTWTRIDIHPVSLTSTCDSFILSIYDISESKRIQSELVLLREQLRQEATIRKEQLSHTEQRFRDFAAASSDWFWETDREHRFLWLSGSFAQQSGLDPQSILGRSSLDLMAASLPADQLDGHRRLLAQQQPFRDVTFQHQRNSRQTGLSGPLFISVSGVPVYDQDGFFTGYRGTGSNITARVLARQAAQASEHHLLEAMNSFSDGFLLWDREDRLLLWNQAFLSLYPHLRPLCRSGATLIEMVRAAMDHHVLASSDRDTLVGERLSYHQNPGAPLEIEYQNGRWVKIHEKKTPDGFTLGVYTDISNRKKRELAATQKESDLSFLLSVCCDRQQDPLRTLQSLLSRASLRTGLADSMIVRIEPADPLPEADPRPEKDNGENDNGETAGIRWQLVIEDCNHDGPHAAPGLRLSGQGGWPARLARLPALPPAASSWNLGNMNPDMARSLMAEAALPPPSLSLPLSPALPPFLAQFRSLLAVALPGAATGAPPPILVLAGTEPRPAAFSHDECIFSCLAGYAISGLWARRQSSMAAGQTPRTACQPTLFSLSAFLAFLAQEASSATREAAGRRGIAFSVTSLPGDDFILLFTDRTVLARILECLLDNAFSCTPDADSSPSSHKVSLAVRKGEDGSLIFRIVDTGPGLAEARLQAALAFPLRQTDLLSPDNGPGLPLAKALAQQLEAKLEIHSIPAQGTAASLVLPPSVLAHMA